MTEDLYKVLGAERKAPADEIKKAYRKLARRYHPDRNKNNPGAEERFKKISAAYAVLGDEKKRSMYDQYGIDGLRDGFDPEVWQRYGSGGMPGGGAGQGVDFGGFSDLGSMGDLFESLFGGMGGSGFGSGGFNVGGGGFPGSRGRPSGGNGADVQSTVAVELMDTILGKDLSLAFNIEGQRKELKVTIPRGIEEGQKIRLKGQGTRSPFGGAAGDLILTIEVRTDSDYKREGMNLIKKQRIDIPIAYSGGKVPVDTPWGGLQVNVPPGTSSGKKLRIKGKGVHKGQQKGDLYVELMLQLPDSRSAELDSLMETLASQYQKTDT